MIENNIYVNSKMWGKHTIAMALHITVKYIGFEQRESEVTI